MFLNRLKVLAAGLLVLCSVAIAFGVRQARADKKDTLNDDKQILGTWTVVYFDEGGQKAPKGMLKEFKVTFTADGKMKAKQGKKEQEFTWKLDPSRKPRQFDATNTKGWTVRGIYALDGDDLTLCWARRGDRPTEFACKKGAPVVYQVLRREKK
jgi:uncharacterized protein (TIGR03067 family)